MKKAPKIFFLTAIICCYLLCVFSMFFFSTPSEGKPLLALVLMVAGLLFLVLIWFSLWYKAWSSIQDGQARMNPAKAIVFSLIPIYNLYWFFHLIWGFAKDYNKYIERHNIDTKKLPVLLFLFYCVLMLAEIFLANIFAPFGFILSQLLFVFTLVIVWIVCDAINGVNTLNLMSFEIKHVEE